MQIGFSELWEKHDSSSRARLDSLSNVTAKLSTFLRAFAIYARPLPVVISVTDSIPPIALLKHDCPSLLTESQMQIELME
jgi:hypothetical protein